MKTVTDMMGSFVFAVIASVAKQSRSPSADAVWIASLRSQ